LLEDWIQRSFAMQKSVVVAIVALGVVGCNDQSANDTAAVRSAEQEAGPGVTPTDQPPMTAPAGAVMDAASPQSAQVFANAAAASDAFEIESSRMALSQSASDAVKSFAQNMIDAHTQSTANLKQAVSKADGVSAPAATPDAAMNEKLDALRALEGAAFDKAYSAAQVEAHQKTAMMLRDYAASGTDPALKAFANETAPVVEGHLEKARSLKP
jgi:putative membrane protein